MSYDFSVKPIKAFRSDLGKVNIIVTGKLGVGKSTLINAMFGKEFARTGEGRLITQEIKEYSCGEYPVSLIDTKGIELSSYKNDINDIEKYVKQHQESKDTHSHIHVAWVCVPDFASRIEDAYKELIGMLSQYMPVIAVITKLGFDSGLQNTIKMECPTVKEAIRVQSIKVEIGDDFVIKPLNLEELAKLTNEYLSGDKRSTSASPKKKVNSSNSNSFNSNNNSKKKTSISNNSNSKKIEDKKLREIINKAKIEVSNAKKENAFLIAGIDMISKILDAYDLEIEKDFIIKVSIALFCDKNSKFKKFLSFVPRVNIRLTYDQKETVIEKSGEMLLDLLKQAYKEKENGEKLSENEIKYILIDICDKMNDLSFENNEKVNENKQIPSENVKNEKNNSSNNMNMNYYSSQQPQGNPPFNPYMFPTGMIPGMMDMQQYMQYLQQQQQQQQQPIFMANGFYGYPPMNYSPSFNQNSQPNLFNNQNYNQYNMNQPNSPLNKTNPSMNSTQMPQPNFQPNMSTSTDEELPAYNDIYHK